MREAVWDRRDTHRPVTRLVSIENTNNSAGGRVWPIDEIAAVAEACREHDLHLHLDGARLMNASVASGVPAAEIGRHFDTVTLCLSKGLGCPLGALVAGSEKRMAKARRLKHLFGGAMRQAGVVAAAGVYALDNHVALLADDHARAHRLAEGWRAAGLPVDLEQVESNFVQLDVEPLGLTAHDVIATLRDAGVGVSSTVHPTKLRAVTHLDLTDEDIDAAIELAPEALAARGPLAVARDPVGGDAGRVRDEEEHAFSPHAPPVPHDRADEQRRSGDGGDLDGSEGEGRGLSRANESRAARGATSRAHLRCRRDGDLAREPDLAAARDDDCAAVLGGVPDDGDDHGADEELRQAGGVREAFERVNQDLADERRRAVATPRVTSALRRLQLCGSGACSRACATAKVTRRLAGVEDEQDARDRDRRDCQRVPVGIAVPAGHRGDEEEQRRPDDQAEARQE